MIITALKYRLSNWTCISKTIDVRLGASKTFMEDKDIKIENFSLKRLRFVKDNGIIKTLNNDLVIESGRISALNNAM